MSTKVLTKRVVRLTMPQLMNERRLANNPKVARSILHLGVFFFVPGIVIVAHSKDLEKRMV